MLSLSSIRRIKSCNFFIGVEFVFHAYFIFGSNYSRLSLPNTAIVIKINYRQIELVEI